MSSIFSISSVTNAGIAAMQEALDHGYTMVFTAMKTGNGVYTTGEDVTGRTALKSLKNTYTIGSIEEDTDGATVSAVFTNYDGVNILVAEDYKINEIGLFCTVNSVEYLYALAAVPNDDGMEMPAYDVDAENLTQFIQEWYVANSNHANIAVNPGGAYIPVTDIVDNLTSTSTTKPLSAKQGKVLNDAKQPKTLSSPITIGGTSQTTVEGALGGLNTVKAERADITSISCTGSINATGETITNGSRFYLNGALCRATADIANGATFTLNTNFKVITVDEELTELNSNLYKEVHTASANQTYAQQLAEIKPYYDALPDWQKRRCILIYNPSYSFAINVDLRGFFTESYVGTDAIITRTYRLTDLKVYLGKTEASRVTFDEQSGNTNSAQMILATA